MAMLSCQQNKVFDSKDFTADTSALDYNFHLSVYQVTGGYGYKISVDGNKLINQPFIPAIDGKNPFVTPQNAFDCGWFVVKLLSAGNTLPSVTVDDLKNLHVQLPESNNNN